MDGDLRTKIEALNLSLPLSAPKCIEDCNNSYVHMLHPPLAIYDNPLFETAFDALPEPLYLGGQELGPVMVASPHGGRCYPAHWFENQQLAKPRSLEDTGTDILSLMLAGRRRPVLIAQIGRAICDLNRPEHALDPLLCSEYSQIMDQIYKPYISAGYGVIPRLSADRQPLHNRIFSPGDIAQIIAKCHHPYHHRLSRTLTEILHRHNHAILIDIHSMPDANRLLHPTQKHKRASFLPDFVFGNLHGTTLSDNLVKEIDKLMHGQLFSWDWNRPYAGGYTTRHYGLNFLKDNTEFGPEKTLEVLQIEVNRAIFTNKKGQIDITELYKIAQILDALIQTIETACQDFG